MGILYRKKIKSTIQISYTRISYAYAYNSAHYYIRTHAHAHIARIEAKVQFKFLMRVLATLIQYLISQANKRIGYTYPVYDRLRLCAYWLHLSSI